VKIDKNIDLILFDTEWMFNVKDGFDVVIGNPPYIDSEKMTSISPGYREKIDKNYTFLSGNWDIYIAFFWMANTVSSNVVCFITPKQWLSKPYGDYLRNEIISKKLSLLVNCGRAVFEKVTVDAIITLLKRSPFNTTFSEFTVDKKIRKIWETNLNSLKSPYYFDYFFTPYVNIIHKLEAQGYCIGNFCSCEGACATSDAYNLVPYITEASNNGDLSLKYKLVNTGTISKFFTRWGEQQITYLKKELGYKPLRPIVDKEQFQNAFGKAYTRRAKAKKVIMKGLNHLDCCLDLNGDYLPGKSTLVVCNDNIDMLKIVCALLNSTLAFFYYKVKYTSCSYCGGISFTPDMINAFPVREMPFSKELISIVDDILLSRSISNTHLEKLDNCVYNLYGLTPEEIAIIEDLFNKK